MGDIDAGLGRELVPTVAEFGEPQVAPVCSHVHQVDASGTYEPRHHRP